MRSHVGRIGAEALPGKRRIILAQQVKHSAAGLLARRLVVQLEDQPAMSRGSRRITGPGSLESFEIKAGNLLEIRDGQAQDTARAQYPATLAQKRRHERRP